MSSEAHVEGAQCDFRSVKDQLLATTDRSAPTKLPAGAQQTAWMALMKPPSDHYNEVYPNILLGDSKYAREPGELKRLKVTHVINCACGTKFNMINTSQDDFREFDITFHGIPATDIMTFKMAPHLPAAVSVLKSALESGGRVYVHCMSGVSRSATVVLAYLMQVVKMPLPEAARRVQAARAILPNDGFLRELVAINNDLFSGPGDSVTT